MADLHLPVRPSEETREVPVHLCLRPFNDREFREEADLARLTGSVEKHGTLQAISCVPELVDNVEHYRVFAGWSRVLANRRAGKTHIPAHIYFCPLTESEQLILTITENDVRSSTNPIDRARWYARLQELNPEWTQADLARAVQVSPGQLTKDLRIFLKLPAELQAKIGSGPGKLAPRAAYALTQLEDVATVVGLADKVMKELLKVESLESEVARLKGSKKPRAKPVKVVLPGVTLVFQVQETQKAAALLALAEGGLKKLEKHGLPFTALPSVLKAPEAHPAVRLG